MASQAREDDETLIKETGVALNNSRKRKNQNKDNDKILSNGQGPINRSGSSDITTPSTLSTKQQQKPGTLTKVEIEPISDVEYLIILFNLFCVS